MEKVYGDVPGKADGKKQTMRIKRCCGGDVGSRCGGQWLKQLEKEEPQTAEKVKTILQEIKLEEIPGKKGFPELGVIGIAAGGAAAGAGVGAWILHLGTWGTLLSAAIPAVVLYPAMKGYQKSEREKAEREGITKYLEQLSLVREEIDGVLNCSAC